MGRRINLADGLTARGECGGISIGAASSRATLIDASSTQQRHVVACSTGAPGAQILPDGAAGMADGSLWVVMRLGSIHIPEGALCLFRRQNSLDSGGLEVFP